VTLGSVAEAKKSFESAIRGDDVTGVRPDIFRVSDPHDGGRPAFPLDMPGIRRMSPRYGHILLETWNRRYD
jgi:hypothetical protein